MRDGLEELVLYEEPRTKELHIDPTEVSVIDEQRFRSQVFTALNGGPSFKFTEAISFVIRCDSQEEVDDYWAKLSAGGGEGQCGWLKDKFGLSWQIVPARLPDLIKKPKALQAMLKMKKLDIAELERAAER